MAPTIGVNLRVTGHCNQGSRRHMEDMFSVAYQQTDDELDLEYAYFGIFDGHGGHEAATFAKEHLMKAIVSQPGFWSDNDKDVLRAIKDGFISTHYAMWRNLENWPKTQSGWPSTSGTTASIAFIRRSNIYIGHVGDSCIVLGYQDPCSDHWKGAALTQDHKPENPVEFKRISQAGGMVVQKSGVPRVVWHRPRLPHKGPLTRSTHIDQIPFLAVARSLGDLWSYNADSDRFVVSPEPDVSVHHIDLTRDKCLIFGTDGLWNMLTPDEAVGIVKKAEINNKSNKNKGQGQIWVNPSKCLVDNALNKWIKFELRADNTSAVTLLLDPLGPPHSQILNQQSAISNVQTEFVPYHIETFKVSDFNSQNKFHSQSSGLAICTWYPHKNLSENFKGDEPTTLSTMEELFGKKVDMFDCKNGDTYVNECGTEQSIKANGSNLEVLIPTTSKNSNQKISCESKTLSPLYSNTLLSPNCFTINTKQAIESGQDRNIENTMTLLGVAYESENVATKVCKIKNENGNQEIDDNAKKMTLRSILNKTLGNESILPKNYQKNSFPNKSLKRCGKRGKKQKNYNIGESQLSMLNETKSKSKCKRRHSSLLESINLIYEPKPKRRTKSEDQKRPYDIDDQYLSDAENNLKDDIDKSRKTVKVKTKLSEFGKRADTIHESFRQNHLQERLHNNCNNNHNNKNNHSNNNKNNNSNNNNNNDSNNYSSSSSSNSNNNNNNNYSNSKDNNKADNSNDSLGSGNFGNNANNSGNGSNMQSFTQMRLRSTMPVKTLRSRNINLEICDWFFLGLTKYNISSNKKSISKQQNCKPEELCDNTKNLSKLNILTRSSLNTIKTQLSESSNRSSVHTRSQNKRLRK